MELYRIGLYEERGAKLMNFAPRSFNVRQNVMRSAFA